jgi:hypothetical protein
MTYDENGSPIDFLRERNEEIKEFLADKVAKFAEEKEMFAMSKKPPKFGYRFAVQFQLALARYGQLGEDRFLALTHNDLQCAWYHFLELIGYYNETFEITANKQMFLIYLGISDKQFERLEKHEDTDIRQFCEYIDTSYLFLGFVEGENGGADAKAVSMRLKAQGVGHSVISAVEAKVLDRAGMPSENEVHKQLQELGINFLPK